MTSGGLMWGQRRAEVTTAFWLVQLVTVIIWHVTWHSACRSQTAANLTAPKVVIHNATLGRGAQGQMG